MPRRLTEEMNELHLRDNISSGKIVLYYRMPTTRERFEYSNESITHLQKGSMPNIIKQRRKFGLAIFEGFRDGDFEAPVNGKMVKLSSNPQSKLYNPDWKNLVAFHAVELVEMLAIHVFEHYADICHTQENAWDLEKN